MPGESILVVDDDLSLREFLSILLARDGYVVRAAASGEAAMAAAYGLRFEEALASITIDAARLLEVDDRIGSIQVGKDADLALFDGDPFEYTSHCTAVVIDGQVVKDEPH